MEPEPTQFSQSRSRLRDLGLPEPEPPKKVAALQHWLPVPNIFKNDKQLFFGAPIMTVPAPAEL